MTTAIVKRELTPDIWATIEKVAPTMQKSRLFGVATVEQAAAIMLKGYELGLGMTASFEFIHIIQDKPSLSPRGALALIIQSGECEKLLIEDLTDDKGDPTACQVTMKRRGGIEYITKYTINDAKTADLIKAGGGWAKYPANMLRWRAIGYAADVVFPDIIGGMKRADEMGGAITPEGNVVDGEWNVVGQAASTPAKTPAVMLNDLIYLYGAEFVLATCNNAPPTTLEGVTELAEKLKAAAKKDRDDVTIDAVEELAT